MYFESQPYNRLIAYLFFIFYFNCAAQNSKTYLFVGNYTGGVSGNGLYIYEFNSSTGHLKEISHIENITNPSFLDLSPNGKYLYACTDSKIPGEGSVSAFKIDSLNGRLTFINKQKSGGENPVYLSVYKNNQTVVNANYTAGNVSVFRTNLDGSLNPYTQLIQFSDSSLNKERQDKSHIHAAVFSPDYQTLYLPDLGADKIRVFKFEDKSEKPLIPLEDHTLRSVPGSGPRHFTFHPKNKFAYCIEELSGMVSVYSFKNEKPDSIQRIFSYSKIQNSYGSSDIHISPDGLYLYASNRWENENTISIFSIDQKSGKLALKGHQATYGDHPRNFVIDPTGNFLLVANQVSNTIVVFKRNLKTGLLQRIGEDVNVQMPSCLKMRVYHEK